MKTLSQFLKEEQTVVAIYATNGGKYQMKVYDNGDNTININHFVNGQIRGAVNNVAKSKMSEKVKYELSMYRDDGINLKQVSGQKITEAFVKTDEEMREDDLRKNRIKINNALIKAGLDGNGRFKTISAMQIAADQVMTPLGFAVDWDEMMTAGNTGHKAITILAFLDGTGKGKPIEIKQRKFSIQWELRNPDDDKPKQWAAVAYVS